MFEITIYGMDVIISENNIKIKDSAKIKNESTMKIMLNLIRAQAMKKGITYKRSNKSWIQEWKSHNLLFKFHLFYERTKDLDLDENESNFRLFCFKILGR